MNKLKENQVPSYRLHKQSGQAVVTLDGKDYLLGTYNSATSKRAYQRLTTEWFANRGADRCQRRSQCQRTGDRVLEAREGALPPSRWIDDQRPAPVQAVLKLLRRL